MKLPEPECIDGYTTEQLKQILVPENRYFEFNKWMYGQTGAICEGRRYSYAKGCYEVTGCGPHGMVTYASDLERFLAGKPIID